MRALPWDQMSGSLSAFQHIPWDVHHGHIIWKFPRATPKIIEFFNIGFLKNEPLWSIQLLGYLHMAIIGKNPWVLHLLRAVNAMAWRNWSRSRLSVPPLRFLRKGPSLAFTMEQWWTMDVYWCWLMLIDEMIMLKLRSKHVKTLNAKLCSVMLGHLSCIMLNDVKWLRMAICSSCSSSCSSFQAAWLGSPTRSVPNHWVEALTFRLAINLRYVEILLFHVIWGFYKWGAIHGNPWNHREDACLLHRFFEACKVSLSNGF